MMQVFSLNRNDTSVLKGIAICAMLFHHLYCCSPDGIEKYQGLLFWLGDLGKVCVSLFLFCSGYGLASNYSNGNIVSVKGSATFVAKRLLKFYTNYWVVLLVFIPISVFVFGRTFEVAYAGLNIPKRIVFELFAFNATSSYNATWWFNAVIVILYLLFPMLYWLSNRFLVASFVSLVLFRFGCYIPLNYAEIYFWQFPFVLGIFWSMNENRPRLTMFFSEHRIVCWVIVLLLFVLFVIFRVRPIIPYWQGGRIDPFITLVLVMLIVLLRNVSWVSLVFAFLGKHSMNIYLVHTFFNGYWCPQWLHTSNWMRYGGNFFVLLSICLVVSLFLEWMKRKFGIYLVLEKMLERFR